MPAPISRQEPFCLRANKDMPWLDQDVLLSSRSHQVCMSCHFFRQHPWADGIPLLACHLYEGLIAHGEHLTRRCCEWQENLRPPRLVDPPSQPNQWREL